MRARAAPAPRLRESRGQNSRRWSAPTGARRGFSLLELVIVLLVLVALAAIVVPLVSGTRSEAERTTTEQTLANVRDAVIQYWVDAPKRLPRPDDDDTTGRQLTSQLLFLFVNPNTWDVLPAGYEATFDFDPNYKVGWRGPYLSQATGNFEVDGASGFTTAYGATGDKALLDAWGNPIVLQDLGTASGVQTARLVSAGPDKQLGTGDDVDVEFTLR